MISRTKNNNEPPTLATSDLGNRLNWKMVSVWDDLLRLFAIARVANPNNGHNLVPNPL
jgi:hypothetical protein